jgi:hypothetical protein
MEPDDLQKYIVPVFMIVVGETEQDACEYVRDALDSTELVFEDGFYSVEVIEDEVEEYVD